jgi:hypothetical protein
MKTARMPVLLLAGMVFLATSGMAQSTNASLNGQVTDQSGAAVPNVALMLTSVATGSVSTATSGSDGSYTFPNLSPGIYNLKASAKGFRDYAQNGIELTHSAIVHQDISLVVGTAVQTVEVAANASPLNTTNAELKGSITPSILKELPIEVAGTVRSAANFAILMPGVTTGSGGNAFDARINGGLQSGDEAILDGVSLQEGLMSQSGMVSAQTDFPTSPDMVGEVTVLTSNYEPQYGSSTSGQIILETKSGTNTYHGSLYEYHRNTVLNARQFGVDNRPADLENEFGASFGGPVWIPKLWPKTKRTFFYLNMEGYRVGGGLTAPVLSVPTLAERQGDFGDWVDSSGNLIPVYDPATLRANPGYDPNKTAGPSNLPFLRNQFMGCDGHTPNVICPSDPRLQNSLAPAWFKFLPAPNRPGIFNNYLAHPRPENLLFHTNYLDIRVDQYFRDKDHFSGSVYYQGAAPNYVSELPAQISYDNHASPEYAFIDRIGWDHTFSPTVLNHAAAGYHNRMEGYGSNDQKYANDLPQIPGVATHDYPPQINISGFTQMGEQSGIDSQNVTARPDFTVNDLLTWVRGKHTFKFGGEYRWLAENNRQNNMGSGTFSFGSTETGLLDEISGSPVASFLLGQVDSGQATFRAVGANYPRANAWIWHIGDTWKVTPKLTVNLGVRYDRFTPSVEKFDRTSFFDPLGANPDAGGRPGRLAFAGNKWGSASFGRRAPEQQWNRGFAPRIGIAYSWRERTVIRGGYGIFYTQAFYPGWGGGIAQDGFSLTPTFSSPNSGLSPAFLLSQGLPQNFAHPPFIDPGFLNGQGGPNYRPFDANRLPYAQQWNLTIEHTFTDNTYVSVAYVGNKGTRLPSRTAPINSIDPKYLSLNQKLLDTFGPTDAQVDGVPAPYPGWASQMQACSPTVAQALMPFPQYCNVLYGLNENAGNSTYHAFQAKVEKRFSRGLWILTSYTASKTLDDADNTQADALTWSGAHGVISPFERERNKALAVDDVPQVLSQALVYELPFGRGKHFASGASSVVNGIIGGWSISSVLRFSSGTPFFFRSGYCNLPTQFASGCIPAVKPGMSPFLVSKGKFDPNNGARLFNVNAFEDFNSFNFYLGQGPRISNYRGFGYHNHDIGIIKDFHIRENVTFQLRAEFFNAWNWHIFNCKTQCWGSTAFDMNPGDSTFGQWNGSVTDPRNIQVAGRINF